MEFITKGDYAYQRLRNEIIDGKIPCGTKLIVKDLAEKYNLSAMPIRNAISKLEQIGLVENIPHIGAHVSSINIINYFTIMLIRTEVEAVVTFFATLNRTDEDIKSLEKILKEMCEAKEKCNFEAYGKANRAYHTKVNSSSYNAILIEQIDNLINRTHLSLFYFSVIPETMEQSYKEHVALLEAIKNKNVENSTAIIRYQRCRSNIAMLNHVEDSVIKGKELDMFIQSSGSNIDLSQLKIYKDAFNYILDKTEHIKELIL